MRRALMLAGLTLVAVSACGGQQSLEDCWYSERSGGVSWDQAKSNCARYQSDNYDSEDYGPGRF